MDQVSRPFQIVLVLALGFAGVWFMALRPKADTGGGSPAPAPAAQAPTPQSNPSAPPAQSDAATPPRKSPIPGGLGRAVDKANDTKATGDAAATAQNAPAQNTTATPVQTPPTQPAVKPAKPAPKVAAGSGATVLRTGTIALGLVNIGFDKTIGAKPARQTRPGFATPGKVRAALAKRHAVVLLFFSARSSDDRAVRREIAAVDRPRGRLQVYGGSERGLSRFKNILDDVQVLENPTVVVLSRRSPYAFPGYTDHVEIDQATAAVLRPRG
jgi:hypothetical protein